MIYLKIILIILCINRIIIWNCINVINSIMYEYYNDLEFFLMELIILFMNIMIIWNFINVTNNIMYEYYNNLEFFLM